MLIQTGYGLSRARHLAAPSAIIKSFAFTSALPIEFTYTRSGVQTVRNSSGQWVSVAANTPPFDHTAAGVPLGLRFEPTRTNKTTQRNFAPTDTTGITVISGTATVDAFDYADVANATIRGASISPLTNGKVIRIQCGASASIVQISDQAGNSNAHSFRVCVTSPATGFMGNVAFSDGSGQVNYTSAAAGAWVEVIRENVTPNNAIRYLRISLQANTTWYIIGTQIEEGPFLTSPIVTSGAQATRNIHSCSASELDLVNWFNNTEGAIVCEAVFEQVGFQDQYAFIATASDNTLNNSMGLFSGTTNGQIQAKAGVQEPSTGSRITDHVHCPVAGKRMPLGMTWHNNEVTAAAGPMRFERRTHAQGSPVGMSKISLGGRPSVSSSVMCGWVKSLTVINRQRSLAQLGAYMFSGSGTYKAIACGGQSNKHGWFRSQVGSGNNGERNGLAQLDLKWTASENWLIHGAENSSYAIKANDPNAGTASANWWYDPITETFGPRMQDWEEIVTAFGVSRVQAFDWDQGESDSTSSIADLKQAYLAIFGRMRSVAGAKPVFVTLTGRRGDGESTGYNNVRRAYRELAAENNWIHVLPEKFMQELVVEGATPTVHLTDAGYGAHATIAVRKMLAVLGETMSGPVDGPGISFSRSGTTLTGAITYPSGGASDFTGGSADVFAFFGNGANIALSGFTKVNATSFTMTLATTPTGIEEVYYVYGTEYLQNATYATDFLKDNSGYVLPVKSVYQVL